MILEPAFLLELVIFKEASAISSAISNETLIQGGSIELTYLCFKLWLESKIRRNRVTRSSSVCLLAVKKPYI